MQNETINQDNILKSAVEEIEALIATHKDGETEYDMGTVRGLELALDAINMAGSEA